MTAADCGLKLQRVQVEVFFFFTGRRVDLRYWAKQVLGADMEKKKKRIISQQSIFRRLSHITLRSAIACGIGRTVCMHARADIALQTVMHY